MTKEEFVALQLQHQQSGKSLKKFLQEVGVCYSKYNYWNRKCKADDTPHELAAIMFTEPKGKNYTATQPFASASLVITMQSAVTAGLGYLYVYAISMLL